MRSCQYNPPTPERQEHDGRPQGLLVGCGPGRYHRYIETRGEAEIVEDGALEHLDKITRQYTDHTQYYGYVYPVEQKSKETRIICRIHAVRIALDAIHR
jgi:hypothetical protein